MIRAIAAAFSVLLTASAGMTAERPIQLKSAAGLDKVEAHCGACHSLDYIQMNSPFPTGTIWQASVTKMIKTFGAPIDDADAKVIVEYLTKNYGNDTSNTRAAR